LVDDDADGDSSGPIRSRVSLKEFDFDDRFFEELDAAALSMSDFFFKEGEDEEDDDETFSSTPSVYFSLFSRLLMLSWLLHR
jgi:hypothetical protein